MVFTSYTFEVLIVHFFMFTLLSYENSIDFYLSSSSRSSSAYLASPNSSLSTLIKILY